MAQHFLLSPAARDLRDDHLQLLLCEENEGLCYVLFLLVRWGSLTHQVCPRCGVIDSHTPRASHRQWRCTATACRHDFSAKSGSLFDGSKLPYWKILKAIHLWADPSKGMSAVNLARRIDVSYETAYLLLRKLRFALFERALSFVLSGQVEMDAVWLFKGQRKMNCRIPGVVKKANQQRRRKYAVQLLAKNPEMTRSTARRLAASQIGLGDKNVWQNPNKRPAVAIVERSPGGGVTRGVGFLLDSEAFSQVEPIARRFVQRGASIFTDAAQAYSGLAATYELHQINHDEYYSQGPGLNTNAVESSFGRFRRMEWGTYHRLSPNTANGYMAENFWREEHRHVPASQRLFSLLSCALRTGVCAELKKYGTTQRLREHVPRKIYRRPIPAPSAHALDRLCGLGFLPEHLVREAAAKRDQLRAFQEPAASGLELKLQELRSLVSIIQELVGR